MVKKYVLVIVEDQQLLTAGVSALAMPDMTLEIAGSADNYIDTLRLVEHYKPDLVLMDMSVLGNQGIKAISLIKRSGRGSKILILTSQKSDEHLRLSLKAGADGYMVKDIAVDELRIAIRTVLHGRLHLSPDITDIVINGYLLSGHITGSQSVARTETLHARAVQLRIVK